MVLQNIQVVKVKVLVLVVTLKLGLNRVLCVRYGTQSFFRDELARYDTDTVSAILDADQGIL